MSVRLICGDCLDVLPSIPDSSAGAVITDPPYMLGAASARKSADKAIGWADINNASVWYLSWMREAWRLLSESGSLWVFGNWRSLPVYQCAASKVPGMSVLSVVIWDKEWPSVGSTRGLRQTYELVAVFGKPGFAIEDRSIGDIWKCKWTSSKPTGHPQEKPVALIDRILNVIKLPAGSPIIDPFLGSGTTGVSAVGRGHPFTGIELDESHFRLADNRIKMVSPGAPVVV